MEEWNRILKKGKRSGTRILTEAALLSPGMNSNSGVVPRANAITLTLPKKRRPVLSTADWAYIRSRLK